MTDVTMLFIELIAVSAVIFVMSLVLHELGHLVCGLIGGYRLVYIEFFGMVFWGRAVDAQRKKLKRYVKGLPAGQCVMVPDELKPSKRAALIVKGGCIVNMVLTVTGLVLSVCAIAFGGLTEENLLWICAGILLFITDGAMFLLNWFGKSATNDGNTYRLIARDERQQALYRRICRIAWMLSCGRTYGWILDESGEEKLLETNGVVSGSLAEEIQLYRLYALMENDIYGEKTKALVNELERKLKSGKSFFEGDIGCAIATYLMIVKSGNIKKAEYGKYLNEAWSEPAREALKLAVCGSEDTAEALKRMEGMILLSGDYESYVNTIRNHVKTEDRE